MNMKMNIRPFLFILFCFFNLKLSLPPRLGFNFTASFSNPISFVWEARKVLKETIHETKRQTKHTSISFLKFSSNICLHHMSSKTVNKMDQNVDYCVRFNSFIGFINIHHSHFLISNYDT